MRIEVHLKTVPDFILRAYSPREDDVRSILMDVCQAVGERSEFLVSGFGEERWPVDVKTDLPVFLEQLPSVLRAVHEGVAIDIDFYEQGIERSIALQPAKGKYLATCKSRTRWQPDPAIEEIPAEELAGMLLSAREAFMRAFTDMAPQLSSHPWIRQWLRGMEKQASTKRKR